MRTDLSQTWASASRDAIGAAMPRVAVIVLNWNKPLETGRCLESLLRQTYRPCHITLVDNGSRENPLTAFRGFAGQVTLIGNDRNLGYAGGNNRAIARALAEGADFVWLFNNDAEADPDCLARLVAVAQSDPALGLVSPVIRYLDEAAKVWACGGAFSVEDCSFEWFDRLDRAGLAMAAAPNTFMLPGTALLVRRSLLQEVGAFDEKYFAYHEDVDLAIRAARAGFRAALVQDANVYHGKDPTGAVSAHVHYYSNRNEFRLWRSRAQLAARLRKALWQLNTLLKQIQSGGDPPEHRQAMLAGYWHGLLGRTGDYRPEQRMPRPLRRLLMSYPGMIRAMLRLC